MVTAGTPRGIPWFSTPRLAPDGYASRSSSSRARATSRRPSRRALSCAGRPIPPVQRYGLRHWVNVTGGSDLETLWPAGDPAILTEGHAYVAMSIERAGGTELQRLGPRALRLARPPGRRPRPTGLWSSASRRSGTRRARPDGRSRRPVPDRRGRLAVGQQHHRLHRSRLRDRRPDRRPDSGPRRHEAFTKQLHGRAAHAGDLLLEENQAERLADSDYYRVFDGASQSHAPYDWPSYVHAARERDLPEELPRPPPRTSPGRAKRRDRRHEPSYSRMMVRAGIHWINRMVAPRDRGSTTRRSSRGWCATGSATCSRRRRLSARGIRYPDVRVPIGRTTSEPSRSSGSGTPGPPRRSSRATRRGDLPPAHRGRYRRDHTHRGAAPDDADQSSDIAESLTVGRRRRPRLLQRVVGLRA